jgi:hypothetical protein
MVHTHPQSSTMMIEENGEQKRSGSAPDEKLRQGHGRCQRNGKSGYDQLADNHIDRHRAAKVALFPLINEAAMRAALIHFEQAAKQLPLAAYRTAQEQSSRQQYQKSMHKPITLSFPELAFCCPEEKR